MYSACIFCHAPLGRNDAIESFPVGRRLAFDAEKGRLWVVCPACARWNLTPLESRWEAIEECEKVFRESRLRVSTGEVGLARVSEGTTLVRIGNPLRPEMAAWRYGDRFQRRRRQYLAIGAATALGIGGLAIAGPLTGLVTWGGFLTSVNLLGAFGNLRLRTKVPLNGRVLRLNNVMLASVVVRPNVGQGFVLDIPNRMPASLIGWLHERIAAPTDEHTTVHGDEAIRAARHLLPRINRAGGGRREVQDALCVLEGGRDVDAMFSTAAWTPRESLPFWKRPSMDSRRHHGPFVVLGALPAPVRLALEMAIHESDERRAFEGELAALEDRWREAEEIAAIADDLLLPRSVHAAMQRLRG